MIIRANAWTAHLAAKPSNPYFRVHGLITLGNYAYGAVLTRRPRQKSAHELDLDLGLELDNGHIVKTDTEIQYHLPVEYKVDGTHAYTGVNIFVDGNLFHHIEQVKITY